MNEFPPHLFMVGCGNMGGAMLARWIETGLDPARVTVLRPSGREVMPGVSVLTCFPDSLPEGAFVILGMKPQQLALVAAELAPRWRDDLTLISMLAGVTVAGLRSAIAPTGDIVRVMPNTPVALGQGVCALYADCATSDGGKAAGAALMQPLGLVEWIEDEAQFNLVTAISGCGPAFLFRFIDALGAAAAQLGMDAGQAQRLALATVQGAANLAVVSGINPAQLADNVASPGGMTREGLNVLDADRQLERLLLDTLRAARDRGQILAEMAAKS